MTTYIDRTGTARDVIPQQTSRTCGPACVRMALARLGAPVPTEAAVIAAAGAHAGGHLHNIPPAGGVAVNFVAAGQAGAALNNLVSVLNVDYGRNAVARVAPNRAELEVALRAVDHRRDTAYIAVIEWTHGGAVTGAHYVFIAAWQGAGYFVIADPLPRNQGALRELRVTDAYPGQRVIAGTSGRFSLHYIECR